MIKLLICDEMRSVKKTIDSLLKNRSAKNIIPIIGVTSVLLFDFKSNVILVLLKLTIVSFFNNSYILGMMLALIIPSILDITTFLPRFIEEKNWFNVTVNLCGNIFFAFFGIYFLILMQLFFKSPLNFLFSYQTLLARDCLIVLIYCPYNVTGLLRSPISTEFFC
uniref:7TM_GPCR_Srx domain-containing protein n=1 Tax=Heterorhabditis bacteriophora TaxID=37862 RepID=A0A1I7W8H2_HETBA